MAMTSPMHSQGLRIFSNKENATFALPSLPMQRQLGPIASGSSAAHKPRIGGIGRAPVKRSQTSAHAAKPYDRKRQTSTSIARAKGRATSPEKRSLVDEKLLVRSKGRRAAPVPIMIPSAAPASTAAHLAPRPALRYAHVPTRLPRPNIPPVMTLPGEMAHIPIKWAMPRLATQFPALLLVSSQYFPCVSHTKAHSHPPTFAFSLKLNDPAVSTTAEEIRAKVRGREPDICLAVKGKGKEDGPARLLPVNSLVYASQCSLWPNMPLSTEPRIIASAAHNGPTALDAIEELDEAAGGDGEDTISATEGAADITSGSDTEVDGASETTGSDSSDQEASLSDAEPASPRSASSTPRDILHLPLMPLSIPHPASFPLLHTHLHLPQRPLLPALLFVQPSATGTGTSSADIASAASAELAKLGMVDLYQRLEFMHGFWSNLCALGVSSDRTWRELEGAWACVMEVIRGRSIVPGQTG